MRKSSTLLFSLLAIATFYTPKVFSQCNLTANAGPDQVICAPGGLVNLNGSGSGGFSNILWTPSESITDPSSLSTSAEVTQTTTFTLTLSGSGATSNLIVGGNFTGGGAFTSDYIPGTGGSFGILSNEGEYAVGPNSGAFHSNWASCTDHTGGGDMLVVNGATTANENVWCQTVSVSPNTQYEFGTWIASVLSSNPAELQFSINGTLLGSTFNAPSSPCVWSQFFETWNSGSATSAQICIVNQNTEGSGNDFAIDDITFGPVCADTDEMTVTVVDVDAMADPSAVLPCNFGNGINLSGLGSSTGAGVSYLWDTPDGNIVSGANTLSPVVSAAGNYLLTVTLTVGNTICTETALVEVTPDTDIPVAEIAQPNAISCTEPDAILDGTISSIGSNFTYLWTASNGGTISGPNNNPIAAGTTPGNYTLLVTNTLNGCTAEATTTVTANFGFPSANTQASGSLNCNNILVTLNGNNSTPGNLEYFWSTNNGSITSSPDLPTVTVDEPGTYVLTVTNPTNGCSDTEQITVSANTTPPTAIIATPGSINCTATNLNLNASGSTGTGNLSFNWTTSGGNIVSGGQTASPNVNATGSYTVTVTQSSNGCSATATVQVAGDNSLPTISIAPPNPLTCATNQIGLSATTTGSGLTYAWTTASGTIVAGANSLTPTVGATGTYTLTVTQPNGCTAVSSVQVTNNLTPPAAEAGTAPLLNCQSATANLNGNGSASGNGISYQWTTTNGTISTGATTLSPTVTSAGTYYLTVLDAGNGCSAMDSVVVQQNSSLPTVSIAPVASLNCNAETININAASSSSGSGFTFSWATVGGSFAVGQNTLTPTVNGPGIYTLTIINTASQCSSTASVTVTSNFNTPVAAAAQPTLLTCDLTSQMLDATASIFGTNSQINWTATQGGNILAGATTLTPQINEPGLYTLIINDLDSGCADTTQVTVAENVALPTAVAGPTDVLTCTVASVSLNGSGSSAGTGFQYLWTTTDGNIFSGANSLTPTVDAPGTYLLTVENTANGCSATSSVTITQNGNFPSVNAGTSQPLTCTLTQTNLNANADQGSQFSYLWTSADGAILQGETTLSPLVGAPGTYVLTVTNTQNGCSATSSVTLGENVVPPLADAGNPGTLSCTQNELSLNGSGSAPNGSVSLIWTTFNGNIVTGQTTTSPQINAPGTYQLTVTNTANGCTATDQVTIGQDASLPTANAGTADDLTCLVSSVQLDGSASSTGQGFSFEWTTTDGQFQSGQNTLTPTVNAPGTYLLTITNTASNCTTISSVTVAQDIQAPSADAGPDGLLTCNVTQLNLDGNDSSIGPDFSYLWTTTNGTISSGATTLTPTITEPGVYTLEITNTVNGCETTNSVTINENTTPPNAAAATPGELTCTVQSLNLSGAGSSTGAGFGYAWTTSDGNILSGANTISPSVNEPGTYQLTVTNSATGCTNTAQVLLGQTVDLPDADAGPSTTLTCASPSLSLSGSASQGPDFGYAWTTTNGSIVNGASSLTPTVNAGGTYVLTVTNSANGCTSTSQVNVQVNQTEPTVSILPPATLTCLEQTAELNGSGSSTGSQFEYAWTTVDGNFAGPADALQTTIDQPGTYVLTIVNSVNGCENSDEVTVDLDGELPLVEAGPSIELNCSETVGSLTGSTDLPTGAWTASWTTTDGSMVAGANGLTPTVGAPGTYLLTVTNNSTGCSDTDVVTVTEVVFENFEVETLAPSCLNQTGSIEFMDFFGGTPPYQFSVDGGSSFGNLAVVTGLSPGTFNLVVQDANGCELTDVAYLPEPPVVEVELDADVLLNLGDSYQLNAQVNLPEEEIGLVEWSPAATLSCADCLTPLASPVQQTSYLVKVTSKEGCTASDVITIFVKKEAPIYVPNAFSPNGDGTNDVFMIYAGGNALEKIRSFLVFDRWGESVFEYYDFQPNNPAFGWNGEHLGETMNPAVFVWYAEIELIDGSTRLMQGDVTLVR